MAIAAAFAIGVGNYRAVGMRSVSGHE